jgi:hypothetical protein
MEHQLDATITVLLISKISSTCFGQTSWCSIFTLSTLMMHGQTQIMFKDNTLVQKSKWHYFREAAHMVL